MIQPWPQVSSTAIGDFRVFKLRSDLKISPRTGKQHDFFVLESAPWVNVVAVTPEDNLVMVEQFRHGSNTVELEIPGGVMDATDASALATGLRELREETGYEGRDARILGDVLSNPAILTNTTFTILVNDCVLKHSLEMDGGEDLVTRLVPVEEIPQLIATGKIRHSLVIVALYYFELHRRGVLL